MFCRPDTQTLAFSQVSLEGEGLLGSDRHRVERSRNPGSREDLADPSLVESVTSRSTGDRTMVPVVRSSGSGLLTGPTDQSVRRVRSTGPVDRSGPPVCWSG